MPYCIYLRKSRADLEAEARGEGETLARHRRALTDLAAQRHLPVSEVYAEIVSGETISERPEMRRMLSAIETGSYEGVICMDVDRLGRGDGADQARILKTLKYTRTLIITPYKVYDPASSETDEAQRAAAPEQAISAHYQQITHILDVFDEASPAELNALLKQVISKIIYTKTKRCLRNENPAEYLTLDIYPRAD